MECDGECRQCEGDVRLVHVRDNEEPKFDWGYFNYCDVAIADDRDDGFTVTEVTDKF